jgi:hypothetical protein
VKLWDRKQDRKHQLVDRKQDRKHQLVDRTENIITLPDYLYHVWKKIPQKPTVRLHYVKDASTWGPPAAKGC